MDQHDPATEPLAELAGKPVILVVEDELLVRIVQVDILPGCIVGRLLIATAEPTGATRLGCPAGAAWACTASRESERLLEAPASRWAGAHQPQQPLHRARARQSARALRAPRRPAPRP